MAKYLILCAVAIGAALALGCTARGQKPATPTAAEVEFAGVGGLKLQGTFLKPAGEGPFPALLLLPGSGPSDRNGNQPGVQMNVLKDVAERLAAKGVASLRFDKRAVASYAPFFPKDLPGLDNFFSWQAFVGDAEAGFNFLKLQKEIDPSKVGVLGHSEGGAIALAMAKDVNPAALVLVSTCGRDLGIVITEQIRQGYSTQFEDKAMIKRLGDASERVCNTIRTTGKVPDDVPTELKSVFPHYLNKYLHDLFCFDPAKAAAAFHGPVLVVQGDKDVQVSPTRDAPALMAAIPAGHGELYVVKGGSHCLKHPTNPLDPGLSGTTDSAALDKISSWSLAHL
jgi:hypothetical protein